MQIVSSGNKLHEMSNLYSEETKKTESRFWLFMQIVSSGDNLHEASKPVF